MCKIFFKEFCQSVSSTIHCNSNEQFRSMNGRCNNFNNPFYGSGFTKLTRLMKPRFHDGVSEPPKSSTESELPSARLVSTTCFSNNSVPDTKLTLAAMQLAHFVTHDMAFGVGNAPINGCCVSHTLVSNPDKFCMPIPIPSDDPIHKRGNCLNFNRNFHDKDAGCENYIGDGYAQQLNRVTAFLDLSVVYGNNNVDLSKIRSYQDGKMTVETRNGATWPPENSDKSDCNIENSSETCYIGGDKRMNQTPHLTIMHILFLREHNCIAEILKSLNPSWDDEKLFQEARRINVAQYQYIVYYEFLPQILGLNNMKNAGLYVYNTGSSYVNDYSSTTDPSVINEFTGAAFRYFHTMIKGTLKYDYFLNYLVFKNIQKKAFFFLVCFQNNVQ